MAGVLRLITMVCPLALVITMSWFGVFTFVNGYIVKTLGHTDEQWTRATLWFTGGVIFWQLICTEISARIGRRKTVTLALATAAIGYALLAVVRDMRLICPILAMMGFPTAANAVAWMPLIAEAGRDRPGRAVATSQMTINIVAAGSLIAGGYLSAGMNHQRAFLVISVACALCAIVFHRLTRPLEGVHSSVLKLSQVSRRDLLGLLRSPFPYLMLFGLCMEPFNFHTNNQLFPNLARIKHGLTERQISLIVALGRLPALITLIPLAYHIDRLRGLRWYGAGLLCAGIAVVWMGMAQGVAALVVGFASLYVSYGLIWGSNVATINGCIEPRLRDSAFAIMNVLLMASVFGVGGVHNRMLNAGWTFPSVFMFCGAIGSSAGVMLIAYSFSRHFLRSRKAATA